MSSDIATKRKRAGMTQQDLGDMVGMCRVTVARWEARGKRERTRRAKELSAELEALEALENFVG